MPHSGPDRGVRAGIGGWNFKPWRGVFYPEGLPQAQELAFASRALTALEINATFYSRQSRATFERWAAETPDDFVFAVKAGSPCVNRRVLAEAGESIGRFFDQGLDALGAKLGPILWQFMASKRFDAADFAAFLDLLPRVLAGRPLRHCVEVRHASFVDPAFATMCAARNVAICLSDDARWPLIDEPTADFAYARLMRGTDEVPTGYPPDDIADWARRLTKKAEGGPVFAFFIHGGKTRAPAAARSMIERLETSQ